MANKEISHNLSRNLTDFEKSVFETIQNYLEENLKLEVFNIKVFCVTDNPEKIYRVGFTFNIKETEEKQNGKNRK